MPVGIRRVKRQQISDGTMILTSVSALHSHKKEDGSAMKKAELKELYKMMFPEYPDIVTVTQLRQMLGISRQLAYDLINDGYIQGVKIGNCIGSRRSKHFCILMFSAFSCHEKIPSFAKKGYSANRSL